MTAQKSIFIALDGSSNGTVPKGARLALGGLIEHDGSADPLGVKLGVLEDTFTPLVAGTAGMSYDIRAAVFVTNPTGSTANGPTAGANDAVVNVATDPAPGSNARYDVIWVRQHVVAADGGADSDNILEFDVTQGTVAASPSVPAIPTGALALANVLVTSGTTATNTLTFTRAHNWVRARGAGGGRSETVVFTSSDTFNKDDYPWLKSVRVRLVAGGGAGGASVACSGIQASAGAGGGGGGYSEKVIPVEDLAASETVTVGGGGPGTSGGGGGGGGSSFGSHVSATPGQGGPAGSAVTLLTGSPMIVSSAGGGTPGAGTGGDLNLSGGEGGCGLVAFSTGVFVGAGGSSHLSPNDGEFSRRSSSSAGTAGSLYGQGGYGASTVASGSARDGGAGAAGIVIVELFG